MNPTRPDPWVNPIGVQLCKTLITLEKVNTTVLGQNLSIETRLKSFQTGEVDAFRRQTVPNICNTNCKELRHMSHTAAARSQKQFILIGVHGCYCFHIAETALTDLYPQDQRSIVAR